MRKTGEQALVCVVTLAGLSLTYAILGRVLAADDVLESIFGQRHLGVAALLALLFGLRLVLVIVGPAWALVVALRLAAATWVEKVHGRAFPRWR